MKLKQLICIAVSICILTSCTETPKNNSQKENDTVKITEVTKQNPLELNFITDISKKLKIGDAIEFSIKVNDNSKIDSFQLFFNNVLEQHSLDIKTNFKWNSKSGVTGTNEIEVIAFAGKDKFTKEKSVVLYSDVKPVISKYKVIKTYPHDRSAFTQGLCIDGSIIYETTGNQGESTVRKTKLENGDVLQSYTLPTEIFGEGLTVVDNKLVQISWKNNQGFVYDKETFKILQKFEYYTEGWGLTYDGKKIIMSDGTNKLYFLENQTYSKTGQLEVYDNLKAVDRLNELEYINGEIYANIWLTDTIARIDPKTGKVLGYINLAGILPESEKKPDTDVLNGIAYDIKQNKLFVTGKRWPKLYEIIIQ